jgi:hypothetical protein
MNRKALALIAAFSLTTTVSAASAADLDEVVDPVDLAALAELILAEYLNLGDPQAADAQDESFALAIGFTLGVAFSSDSGTFADGFSEGLVLTGSDPNAAGSVGTFTGTFAAPGLAGVSAGLNVVAFNPPDPPLVLSSQPVSPD